MGLISVSEHSACLKVQNKWLGLRFGLANNAIASTNANDQRTSSEDETTLVPLVPAAGAFVVVCEQKSTLTHVHRHAIINVLFHYSYASVKHHTYCSHLTQRSSFHLPLEHVILYL